MSLQIRRGTNAERLTVTPAVGEPIWTTDTTKLFIGDGITPGGINLTPETPTFASVKIGNCLNTSSVTTSVVTGNTVYLDNPAISLYDTTKLLVKVKDGTAMEVIEIVAFTDGTDVYLNEYGRINNQGDLGVVGAALVDGRMRITYTVTSATNMTIEVYKTRLAA